MKNNKKEGPITLFPGNPSGYFKWPALRKCDVSA